MVKEECFYCKEKIGIHILRDHVAACAHKYIIFVCNLHFSKFVYRNSISIQNQNEQVPFFQALKDHVSVSP